MALFVLAASFPIIFVPVVELFSDPSCIFLILKSGQFPSRIEVVQSNGIVLVFLLVCLIIRGVVLARRPLLLTV